MSSKAWKRERRKRMAPGFQVPQAFSTPEQVAAYFGASVDRLQCLLCGKWYRSVGIHLRTHEVSPDYYRERFGLPWTYGLVSAATSKNYEANAREKMADGTFVPADTQTRALAHSTQQRAPVPMKIEQSRRNLKAVNSGKSGLDAARRSHAPKRGSEEYKRRCSERASARDTEAFAKHWLGRRQSPEHVAKRTAAMLATKTAKAKLPPDLV